MLSADAQVPPHSRQGYRAAMTASAFGERNQPCQVRSGAYSFRVSCGARAPQRGLDQSKSHPTHQRLGYCAGQGQGQEGKCQFSLLEQAHPPQ